MGSIYLIRHAEPLSPSRWDGANDTRPLTDRGRSQAAWLANYLAGRGLTAILTSPLVRCVETAEIIGKAAGVTPEVDERLHIWNHFEITSVEGTQAWVAHSNNIPDAVYRKGVSCTSCAHASAWRLDFDESGNVAGHEYILPEA